MFNKSINFTLFLLNSADADRDVFNEKPSKEEQMAATQVRNKIPTHKYLRLRIPL